MATLFSTFLFIALIFMANTVHGQPWTGFNTPGTAKTFQFRTTAAATNFSVTVPGSTTGFSHLYLKKNQPASSTNWDYRSVVTQTNAISLEVPEAAAATWYVNVATPANSSGHSFTLSLQTNVSTLRTMRPVNKPLVFGARGSVPAGKWHYYRIEVPANPVGLTIRLQGTALAPDLYIQRDKPPTRSSYLKRSLSLTNDVIQLSDVELPSGSYIIGIDAATAASYVLQTETLKINQLTFDPGTNNIGRYVFSNTTAVATNFYFKVRTESPSLGAWRTVLKVFSGEANLYVSRGKIPSTNQADFTFNQPGSDGFVWGSGQFSPGQDWYFLVSTRTNTQWSIVSGNAYVHDLGELAQGNSSSTNVTIGPEGWAFFKTTVPADTLAWKLRLSGLTNTIYLKKTGVPLAISRGSEMSQKSQMLVVPPYLVAGQLYFVGVAGTVGTSLPLQSIQQPVTDIDFTSNITIPINALGYSTFRVQVPPSEIAWQVTATPFTGETDIYVRRNFVASENYNGGYSEVPGEVADSITLVPPTLSDGTFFITVAATNTNSFRLVSGRPAITYISFADVEQNFDTNRVGWRYFCVTNIEEQIGALGWDLLTTNSSRGTKIALRRNQVPSAWSYREGTRKDTMESYNFISTTNFLQMQRPGYQADVWYVGVYNPTLPLGRFTLITRPLISTLLNGDGGSIRRTNTTSGKWEYFQVNVPANVAGWDVRLTNVSGGMPKLVIRREEMPFNEVVNQVVTTNLRSTLASPALTTNWPGGAQWLAGKDWTQREFGPPSDNVSQFGRLFAAGMGRPLQPATYYIGVYNASPAKSTYTVMSRFIGTTNKILLKDIAFSAGVVYGTGLGPREAHYYRVMVPPDTRSLKMKLTVTGGEAMLVASTNKIPTMESEKRVQKTKDEHFVLLPDKDQDLLRTGAHYVAVIGEGSSPTNNRVSSGTSSYKLQTFGAMPEPMKGPLGTTPLTWNDTLEGGESKVYHVTVPSSIPGFYTYLENRVGNPVKVGIGGTTLPDPGAGDNGFSYDAYGNLGGEKDPRIIEVSNSRFLFSGNGVATLMLKARSLGGVYTNASFSMRVERIIPPVVNFNAGRTNVVNQTNNWAFFRIDVPPNATGWDVRLTNVISGSPKLVVTRGMVPNRPSTTTGWDPGRSPFWPIGCTWAASRDWTERAGSPTGQSEDGRILAMGMGRPLEPGTYYVGVYANSVSSYTLLSRGIGAGMSIPVNSLTFAGGATLTLNVAPREAAYFRVTVPQNMRSWKLKLETPENSEATMMVLQDTLPNILAKSTSSATNNYDTPGRKLKKLDRENFLLLPGPGTDSLAPGDYYVAVAGEGKFATNNTRIGIGLSSFKLTSVGQLPIVNLGTLTTNLSHTSSMTGGEVVGYQFTVPLGTVSVQAQLLNRVGNPVMVMRSGSRLPDTSVSFPGLSSDIYGNEGGENRDNLGSATVLTRSNPTNDIYTLLVKARATNSVYTNAQFTLRLSAVGSTFLSFDGGRYDITNQAHGSWRYFRIDVPKSVEGWDVRLTNVSAGKPRLIIRRDALPSGLTTTPWSSPGSRTEWGSSNQWAALSDWTRRKYSPNGSIDEDNRILAMGMGKPLEAGSYYIGVGGGTINAGPMSYTLVSRGIGNGYTIPIVDLAFDGGTSTNFGLAPRHAAYFRVVVPEASKSWKLKVTGISGEFMLVGLRDHLPNVEYFDPTRSITLGKSMQKAGSEQFLLLPAAGETNLPASTNYFAVVSEGANITNAQRIGTDSSSFVIRSLGELPVTSLGTLSLAGAEQADTLEGGETKAYSFIIPENVAAAEVKLENRIGNPVMVLRTNGLPNPGGSGAGYSTDNYGNEGGEVPNDVDPLIVTVPNPGPGTYTVLVKARAVNNVYSDASYRILVRELPTPTLNFSQALNTNGFTNVVSGLLETNQRTFFKVEIPAPEENTTLLGWKLELRHASGTAAVRVSKDVLPTDTPVNGTTFISPAAYIVPPYFTNGTWYVEVKGQNATEFTLTSSPIQLSRKWDMPPMGSTNVAPGLVYPTFGDTGISGTGTPLAGNGIFLEQGFEHHYAIEVPESNRGLVRVQMEAISGNPDLYARTNYVPTPTHAATGSTGKLIDRDMKATVGTEYANWVVLDLKKDSVLTPGLWYFAVHASGTANARYRLRFSVGDIDVAPLGATVNNQTVAGGDWRYYRFQMPAKANAWTMTFSQLSGDTWLYIRESVPPGNGISATDFKHWNTDGIGTGPFPSFNLPGTYNIEFPPAVAGATYYLGFRALNDASFSFRMDITNAAEAAALSGVEGAISEAGFPMLNLGKPGIANGMFQADFGAVGSRTYTVEVSDDLVNWTPLTTVSNTIGNAKIREDVEPLRKSRFYRIRVE
jgi:hypothetical protein